MLLRIARLVPANAVLFAALVVFATLIANAPGGDASADEITAYYGDEGDRNREVVALVLIGLSGFCFLAFLGSFRGVLARAEGEPARLTTAAIASGTAFISLAVAAHALKAAPAVAGFAYADFEVDADAARMFLVASWALFVLALFAGAAMTLAASVLALYSGALPRWLAYAGLVATVGGLLSFWVVPSLLVLAWIALVGLYLLWPEKLGQRKAATTL